ncbi:uncharacterized protein LOC121991043 [Zingiber officinale]|uniref:uncharacterized protein LOC121991043 n=1 Tax=Zingiber officinale TaxID=94328 RepID=UPI001C4ADB9D|nr:uncharacterized protein LOC121991043 [Zingiber officinale]
MAASAKLIENTLVSENQEVRVLDLTERSAQRRLDGVEAKRKLLSFDPEIDRTFLRRRNLQKLQEEQETSEMADKLLNDYAAPYARGLRSSITRPPIKANNFEIKPAVIHMVQQNQFRGGPHDDPNHHLELFYEICSIMKVNEVPPETVRLLLFRFFLKDRAKQWLNSLPANNITSWGQCEQKILDKFYPPSKTAHMKNLIASFKQADSESLFEAWDKFKSMLRQCPHHGLEKWLVLHTFYNGINYHTKLSLDSAARGVLMNKSLDEAEDIIENVAQNHHQWATERSGGSFFENPIKASGKFDVDAVMLMPARLDALTKKLETMGNNTTNAIVFDYNQRQNNPYSNTYNPGWRNHPNFSCWGNQDQEPAKPSYQPRQQNHQSGLLTYQQQQPSQLSRIEKMIEEALLDQKVMKNKIKQLNQRMENSEKHQKMQDSQIAQIAQSFSRAPGAFPRKPDINSVEHCNRIKLRSRWTLGDPQMGAQKGIDSEEEFSPLMPNLVQNKDREEITKKVEGTLPLSPQSQTIPFPQKLITSQKDKEFHRFLKKIKEINIEVHLIDALHQMPKFAKFLKGILSNRRQKGDFETVALMEKCSALLTAETPPKL